MGKRTARRAAMTDTDALHAFPLFELELGEGSPETGFTLGIADIPPTPAPQCEQPARIGREIAADEPPLLDDAEFCERTVMALHERGELGYVKPSDEWVNQRGVPLNDEHQEAAARLHAAGRLPGYDGEDDAEPEGADPKPDPAELAELEGLVNVEPVDAEDLLVDHDIVIEHSALEGTLLIGSRKGDGVYDALKNAGYGWRWWRTAEESGYPAGTLFLPGSRDKAPRLSTIDHTEQIIAKVAEEQGQEIKVAVHIDGTPRDQALVIADRRVRAAERAEALDAKAGRRAGAAEGRWRIAHDISRRWEGGQPIIMDHHSTRKALRDRERMDNHMRKSVALEKEARLVAERAEGARRTLANLDNPLLMARWLREAEAELRAIERGLNGSKGRRFLGTDGKTVISQEPDNKPATGRRRQQLLLDLMYLIPRMEHARAELAKAVTEGRWWGGDPKQIRPGDFVLIRGQWDLVEKVNPKTIRVISIYMPTGLTYPHLEIRGHRTAEEHEAIRTATLAEAKGANA
ncbi:DUF3560 domain-containing protein [Saccharothrix hoggarensis]|uniref:DUF3560 domain-containing protein n=1 Tax=Saccharothrix hoggarensis TaxID=913853 RepID=A0ABW3QLP4_9PSEU